jgi:hypothetical protein
MRKVAEIAIVAALVSMLLLPGSLAFAVDDATTESTTATEPASTEGQTTIEDQTVAENQTIDEEQVSESATSEATATGENTASASSAAMVTATAAVNATGTTTTAVYLNGSSGSDSNDGLTADTAVKTFSRAKELAAELDSQTDETVTIYITGTVSISGDISLDGVDAIVKREPSFTGYLMNVAYGATATLSSITVDGNSDGVTGTVSSSLIRSYGTLNIEDGTVLQNNAITSTGYFQSLGGAICASDGTINMTGGEITNNSANFGGGVFLIGAEMNMSGGVIENNRATDSHPSSGVRYPAAGGGICLYDRNAVLNVSGSAEIINNTSEDMGGGISVGTYYASNSSETLNMTGGTVSGNTAGSAGGGIYVQAGTSSDAIGIANISGGTISNNSMDGTGLGSDDFGGGGIYVNGATFNGVAVHGVLNLTNVLITENTASLQGGGYAACPISITHVYVNDGAAIYSNTASSANEIYILASNAYESHSGDPYYKISTVMLGGTSYKWKYPDGTEVPYDDLEGTLDADAEESLSLYTDVTSDAAAEALATVVISGNTSVTRGGGIGSNGEVNIGAASSLLDISVDKVWENDESSDRPESIEVELYCSVEGSDDDPVYVGYETMTPDSTGNWPTITFANLPATDGNGDAYVYTVQERSVDGYVSTVSGDQEDGFTITNTHTTTPKTSVASTTTSTSSRENGTSPSTGDPSHASPYILALLALGVVAICVSRLVRKRVRE